MIKKIVIILFVIGSSFLYYSCSNMHMSGGVGLNFTGGPHGPRLTPTMNVGVYGGGPVRW
ncbi:hypothetical protein [Algoriphagus sediminis]|uniref:Uncharacterized protein n=1 Tax=Algoriphagus sediminis TaxID=3057113 RepID=A0ABT7Y8H9_9BACT|nr:hypothetical protein [Algoriphagus sediminis]MDN3202822.1 hypothetical protein [Algoriphagus sediminis]